MSDSEKYITVEGLTTAEFRDRGSRFLAFVQPIVTPADARIWLAALRKEHPKANHHCLAYRIGADVRASDDGEPAGSAGRPMLGALDGAGLDRVGAIVVRYFGGTLLGVPGLINAYRTVVADALRNATTVERWIEDSFEIECDYGNLGDVLRIVRMHEGTLIRQDLQLFCVVVAGLRKSAQGPCLRALSDLRNVTVRPMPAV
jgi:uncharacterized YigZ family protein